MMELLVLRGGELRIQRERRRIFLDLIDGNMFAILWERSLWDISLGKLQSHIYKSLGEKLNRTLTRFVNLIFESYGGRSLGEVI